MVKLNYLAQISQPDIFFAVHQYEKYQSIPQAENKTAIIYFQAYISINCGLSFDFSLKHLKAKNDLPLQIFVSTGTRNLVNHSTAKSQSGRFVTYVG